MQKWEYCETTSYDYFEVDVFRRQNQERERLSKLNSKGREGWELVSVLSKQTNKETKFTFFFKRPKID